MATTDSKGIIRYEAGDSVSPLHTALNLGLDSVSTALDSPLYNTPAGVHVVANSTELTPLRTTMTAAGYPTTDPLYAHRKDTGELYVQETSSGSWGPLTVADTGWVNLTFMNGWSGTSSPAARRIGEIVYFRGEVTGTNTGSGTPAFNLPVGFRPLTRIRTALGFVSGSFSVMGIDVNGNVWFSDARSSTPGWMLGAVSFVADV